MLDKLIPAGKLVKSKLYVLDEKLKADLSKSVTVQFNPSELSIARSNHPVKDKPAAGGKAPPPAAASSGEATLNLTLYYDAQQFGNSFLDNMISLDDIDDPAGISENAKKMNSVIDEIVGLTRYIKGQPPTVQFIWGPISFMGLVTSSNVRYTMFEPSGNPIRAEVSLTIEGEETEEYKAKHSAFGGSADNAATKAEAALSGVMKLRP